jgi:uncharacterized phage protein (TIGR02218 family)
MKGHLAGRAHTRCTCLRLDLADGSTLAITDHDIDISFDIGDGAVTYSASTGVLPSDIALSCGFGTDDVEVVGPVTETGLTTRAAILGGRFDDAVARLFMIDWSQQANEEIALMRGVVAGATVEGSRFRLTVNSEIAKFRQDIGRVITAYCDADFGDARCGYTVTPLAATITAVTDERAFTVSYSGTYATGFFNMGTVTFTSGDLSGIRPVEVFTFTSGGAGAGSVALWLGLPETPAVGDTLQLRQGCGKTRAACLAYDNVVNFRGFPDVPGSDQVLRYPNPSG